jgi:pimeloyl-ACP methyl ester carboxylesterase
MSVFENGPVSIHYDNEGEGFPVLTIAPGGMRSANSIWDDMAWNPRKALRDDYQVIGMDQRNAGRSRAPVTRDDGWPTYAADQLGLLDHLEIDRCHLVGMCIGGPYIFGLLKAAPERFASAVILQPVGIDKNRDSMEAMYVQWAEGIGDRFPDVAAEDWASFSHNMWDGEFVLTASRDEVAAMATPMLVLMGNDLYHPETISRMVASIAPNATLIEDWKQGEALEAANGAIKDFLAANTP